VTLAVVLAVVMAVMLDRGHRAARAVAELAGLEVELLLELARAAEPLRGDRVDLGELAVVDVVVVVLPQGGLPVAGVVRGRGAEIRQPTAAVPQLDHRRAAELREDRIRHRDRLPGGLRGGSRRRERHGGGRENDDETSHGAPP
jgi:hypothetical protein